MQLSLLLTPSVAPHKSVVASIKLLYPIQQVGLFWAALGCLVCELIHALQHPTPSVSAVCGHLYSCYSVGESRIVM